MTSWVPGDPDELAWLVGVATDKDEAGYEVGPMPDKVWLLHPLAERLDGKPYDIDDDAPEREVTWAEYAERRGIPMFVPPGYTSGRDALPGVWHDDLVAPPEEGSLDEPMASALFDVLLRHSAPDTMCTAYWYWFYVGGPHMTRQPPNLLRGPLGAWPEVVNEQQDYVLSPNDLWPDDRTWVVQTHTDSWATAVSGPTPLIEDLLASPDLEAMRLPHLD